MLYELNKGEEGWKFHPVRPTTLKDQHLLEADLQQWLTHDPRVLLPKDERHVLVISRSEAFQRVVDILALDRDGNTVVIELKRGPAPREVLAQALDYAADVARWDDQKLEERALEYMGGRGQVGGTSGLRGEMAATFDLEPSDVEALAFNKSQRVLVVAETFDETLERTARWLQRGGIEIGLVTYDVLGTEDGRLFLDFQHVVPWGGEDQAVRPAAESAKPPLDPTNLSPTLRGLYETLLRRVSAFGEVTTGATPRFFKFASLKNFAELHPKRRSDSFRIDIRLGSGDPSVTEGGYAPIDGIMVRRVPDSYLWTLNHQFVVDTTTDVDAATRLLHRSYEASRAS